MTDLRTDLRDAFRAIVDQHFNADPEDIQVLKTPIGKFADAAADMIGALPSPPRYHPDEEQPKFTSSLTREEIEGGATFDWVSPYYDEKAGRVVIISNGGSGWGISLAPEIAEQFFHQGLAVVRHARERAGN